MPAEEIDLFCISLACYISVQRPATAAESLNPQQQHRSSALCPHGRHNLLSGRLTEDHSSMEMRLGSQQFQGCA